MSNPSCLITKKLDLRCRLVFRQQFMYRLRDNSCDTIRAHKQWNLHLKFCQIELIAMSVKMSKNKTQKRSSWRLFFLSFQSKHLTFGFWTVRCPSRYDRCCFLWYVVVYMTVVWTNKRNLLCHDFWTTILSWQYFLRRATSYAEMWFLWLLRLLSFIMSYAKSQPIDYSVYCCCLLSRNLSYTDYSLL